MQWNPTSKGDSCSQTVALSFGEGETNCSQGTLQSTSFPGLFPSQIKRECPGNEGGRQYGRFVITGTFLGPRETPIHLLIRKPR